MFAHRSTIQPIAVAALLAALLATTPASADVSSPVGVWLHATGRFKVEIAPCGTALCGKIVWFRWPNDAEGLPHVDLKNPDPSLRDRPLIGLRVLQGLRPAGIGKWTGGRIYNPEDGAEYHVEMTISDPGALHVRAYSVLPIFGKTFVWTRVR